MMLFSVEWNRLLICRIRYSVFKNPSFASGRINTALKLYYVYFLMEHIFLELLWNIFFRHSV